jgi:hypothetical protein
MEYGPDQLFNKDTLVREQENCVTLWEQTASISGSKTENRKKAKATLLTKYFFFLELHIILFC